MARRPPRALFWLAGAAIAFAAAVAARTLAETMAPGFRVAVWITGAAGIFAGLWVVSLGTRAHLDRGRDQGGQGDDERDGDAGCADRGNGPRH